MVTVFKGSCFRRPLFSAVFYFSFCFVYLLLPANAETFMTVRSGVPIIICGSLVTYMLTMNFKKQY